MFLSFFDIFKIGIGPSSSHTMGPMSAAFEFVQTLNQLENCNDIKQVEASLHGSLAFTGKGHASDRAVILGMAGYLPEALDPEKVDELEQSIYDQKQIELNASQMVSFDPETDLIFDFDIQLPLHANGMSFRALDADKNIVFEETYYSIGGGFILTEKELTASNANKSATKTTKQEASFPYPFENAAMMLEMGKRSGLSIAQMKRNNEESISSRVEFSEKLDQIYKTMMACVDRGLNQEGILPGGLNVKRRAKKIKNQLEKTSQNGVIAPHAVNDWISIYAMAVNEENASGGKVVTSPTNGAAGVVPAVLRYYRDHCDGVTEQKIEDFLLTASAIGGLIKHNASISGAECGCQAEIGSASAMAAAGLCAALGGNNQQIENAAEIALEHHLGMTCDPVQGLVQVPCIERNGMGAIKAVSAASLALHGDGEHYMPLDNCIKTMLQTGLDMQHKYKETSLGGLAVNLPEC